MHRISDRAENETLFDNYKNSNRMTNENFQDALYEQVKNTPLGHIITLGYAGVEKLTKKQILLLGGNLTKFATVQAHLGNYANMVANRAAKETGEKTEFHSQRVNWRETEIKDKISVKADGTRLLQYSLDKVLNEQYFVNGKPATPAQLAIINEIVAAKNRECHTQAAAGLTEKQVKFRNLTMSRIYYFAAENVKMFAPNGAEVTAERVTLTREFEPALV